MRQAKKLLPLICINVTSKVDMSDNQCVIYSVGLLTDLWHLLVLVIIHFVIGAGHGATFRRTRDVGQHETSKETRLIAISCAHASL